MGTPCSCILIYSNLGTPLRSNFDVINKRMSRNFRFLAPVARSENSECSTVPIQSLSIENDFLPFYETDASTVSLPCGVHTKIPWQPML